MTTPAFDRAHHLRELEAQGYTIIRDFLSPERLAAVRAGLAPFLGSHRGRNDFEGFRTERVYTLVARGRVFEDIAEDPRVLALCDALLHPGYLLTASQAICIHPGETPQPLHCDDSFYPLPRPRAALSLSTIVAVDEFTAENGGTEVIPGSHKFTDAQVEGIYTANAPANGAQVTAVAAGDTSMLARTPAELEQQLVPARMPAGACIFFLGTLVHRGGANRSAAPRLAFSNQYCQPWARTQENFFLGVPAARARAMSPRLQQLLGYSIWGPFMGHVTASHPSKTLRPDYRNAVDAGRGDDA